MVKKIIDVPKDAAKIIFAPDSEDENIDELSFMLHHRVFIEDLPDAPEKRVVELPASLLQWLRDLKEHSSLYIFLGDVVKSGALDDFMIHQGYSDGSLAGDKLANWYLGHVEFVAKKEQKFYVKVDRPKSIYASFIGSAIGKKTVEFWKIPQEVTEEEADELVAGLTALNARKVAVDED